MHSGKSHLAQLLQRLHLISEPQPTEEISLIKQGLELKAAGTEGESYHHKYKWGNIIALAVMHALALYTATRLHEASLYLWIWFFSHGILSGLGVTGGVHRLWSHKSYKATTAFKIFLLYCYTLAGQNSVFEWVRDHRVHHKFSDTDADPHNARRGFFFSHVGWLMVKKHPKVLEKGRTVDMSDIEGDPLIAFHTRHFILLKLVFGYLLPTILPPLLWGESWAISFLTNCFLRYSISLNITWSVNSAAHIWGTKPFRADYLPAENKLVSGLSLGEGWHNYHHAFPWDYRAQELGPGLSFTTRFLDFAASLGLVYDRRTPSRELVRKVATNHGDGSWKQP